MEKLIDLAENSFDTLELHHHLQFIKKYSCIPNSKFSRKGDSKNRK